MGIALVFNPRQRWACFVKAIGLDIARTMSAFGWTRVGLILQINAPHALNLPVPTL
jgi:hypothetical protein